jgi:DNA-directed RNA polymerase subunit H (RpoH/RPB5)
VAALTITAIPAAAQPAAGKAQVVEAGYTMLTATVVRVDLKTREVELRDEKGKAFKISVNEAVKNLDQVKPGDIVNATLTESIAYEVKKPGQASPGTVAKPGEASLKPGEKPKGVVGKVTTKTVTVVAIDAKAQTIRIKEADGEARTIAVNDPSRLVGVKVGDLVEITYTESTAFSVEKAPKK